MLRDWQLPLWQWFRGAASGRAQGSTASAVRSGGARQATSLSRAGDDSGPDPRGHPAAKNFDHITYATFGVEPAEFYAGRFAGGAGTVDFLADPKNRFSIEYGRGRFLAANVKGPRVLDLGCGSAPYAQTLRSNTDAREIVGVDLDSACVALAAQVYDQAATFDVNQPLPFPNGHFDTVFSCDVFGHIEFRHKDRLISEIRRITKPGGRSVHIIESAPLDYDQMTDDPDDPIRKYVLREGHVGIEGADALMARWSRVFRLVEIENAMLYPFCNISGYLADPDTPAELKSIMTAFAASERDAAAGESGEQSTVRLGWRGSRHPSRQPFA